MVRRRSYKMFALLADVEEQRKSPVRFRPGPFMAGERPPLVILAGQPVLNLEVLPEEGCVLLELGATPQMGRVTAKFFPNSSLIEVVSAAAVAQAAGFHLLYFRVALDEKLEVTSYESMFRFVAGMADVLR